MSQQEHEYETEVITEPGVLAELTKAEVDVQIATAKQYPRSVSRFAKEVCELACLDEEIAGDCIYALPRGGKSIEGPSARLAEIVAHSWGNCKAGARVVSEQGNFVVAQGVFHDLEKNVSITYEVKRRITDKYGNRFKDDMIGVTANAACSIALRNAVFKGVPKSFWKKAYDEARRTAIGTAETLVNKRSKMVDAFALMGVTEEMICGKMEVSGIEDIGLERLATLRGMYTALKDGESTIEQMFSENGNVGGKVNESDLNDAVDNLAEQSETIDTEAPAQSDASSEPSSEPRRSRLFKSIAKKIEEYAGDDEKLFALQPEIAEGKFRDGEREELESRLGDAVETE